MSSEFGTYRLCQQRRFRRAWASAQSRQNLRCSLIQAVSQEEPSDKKPDPWPLWMAGHAQLKFIMTECLKTQICLTRHIWPKSIHYLGDKGLRTNGSAKRLFPIPVLVHPLIAIVWAPIIISLSLSCTLNNLFKLQAFFDILDCTPWIQRFLVVLGAPETLSKILSWIFPMFSGVCCDERSILRGIGVVESWKRWTSKDQILRSQLWNGIEPHHEKTCLCRMWTTNLRSLISAFVVHCLDSIIPLLAIAEISRL